MSGKPGIPRAVQSWELQCGDVVPDEILDLREPERFERGHLAGARCVPYHRFQAQSLGMLPPGGLVLVVDPAGARAAEMATWLAAQGVRAAWLEGGMAGWRGPLETPARPDSTGPSEVR